MKRMFAAALAALSVFAAAPVVAQQAWPARPLKLIVPYAPGGSTDQLSRAIAERLGGALGQPVVVENRPGGNTIIGAEATAKAPPDGYTMFMGSSGSLAVNPHVYAKLPYEPNRDFAYVTLTASSPLVLVVNPSVPAKTVREFVDLAKAKPGAVSFASVGNGNPLHLAGELFKSMAGVDMLHVPYNGSAPALAAILGAQVDSMFDVVLTATPHVKAGKLRALGITGPKRVATLPEVPTIAESGYPGYDASIWFGIVVPKGTPQPVVQRLNAELVKILRSDEMRQKFDPLALELMASTPEEMGAFVAKESQKWGKVIRDFNIRIEQ
jgi:tripartite-type tricarboxylate transporter receptor subunit TctC